LDSAKNTPTESALKTMTMFKDNADSAYYNDYTGNIVWFDQRMESTFKNAALQIRNDLEEQFGLDLNAEPDITINNKDKAKTYPEARFITTDGKEFRVDGDGNVFIVNSSGNLISYGKLGETPDPVQTKTAEVFANVSAQDVLSLANQKPSPPKQNIPSASYVQSLIDEGLSPEDAVQKAIEENPVKNPFEIPKPTTEKNETGQQTLREWNEKQESSLRAQKDAEFANRNSGDLTSTQEAYASEIEAEGYGHVEARQLAPLVDKYRVEERLSFEEALKKALKELGIKER